VIGANVSEAFKPKQAHLVQDSPLIGDAIRHHDIERGDAVAGDNEEVVTKVKDLTYFAASGRWEVSQGGGIQEDHALHNGTPPRV
jgi:hypothetical protein